MNTMETKISTRERNAILSSLGSGVVPAIGLQHIQVGRADEVRAVLDDLQRAENDAAAVRFVIGRYGNGKTFFLNLIRTVALERKWVVLQADVTTDRRFHGSSGQARGLYSELMHNLSTRSRAEGGALKNLVERWVGDVARTVTETGGTPDDVAARLSELCAPLQDFVSGYDFATVLAEYYRGYIDQDEARQTAAIRWLRAEYKTKTEAKRDLGVRSIIDDESFYDYLKLFSGFVRIAGYAGCLVSVDELVVLSHRLNSKSARNNNYEALLRIFNDCLQGSVAGLVFLFAATDECLEDTRRGLFSYEALASRLKPNRFASAERVDFSGPILRLPSLTPEDCYVLMHRIRAVHGDGGETPLLPDEGIEAFLQESARRLGSQSFQTPRELVRDFVGLLRVLEQNPDVAWTDLLANFSGASSTEEESDASSSPADPTSSRKASGQGNDEDEDEDDLTTFRL